MRLTCCAEAFPDSRTYWFDAANATWRLVEPDSSHHTPKSAVFQPSLKRRTFPSTLLESGRRAVKAFRQQQLALAADVVLHTTYLGPLIPRLKQDGVRVALDVYDLVWRAHAADAHLTSKAVPRAARHAYARWARGAESRYIAAADQLFVAGWGDWTWTRDRSANTSWIPTGIPVPEPIVSRNAGADPVVGLIGNFAHAATVASAQELIASPAARQGAVRVLLAGAGSERWGSQLKLPKLDLLGHVRDVAEFYENVDVVVATSRSGSGIKVKLAEGILHGRPVVTSQAGSTGYPPFLAEAFTVAQDLATWGVREYSAAASRAAESHWPSLFADHLGVAAVHQAYRRAR